MEFLKLLLLFLPLLRASDTLLSPKGVNYEVAALMSMKSKLRDPYDVLYGWDINSVDPCTWSMIGCSPDGFVISLEMASKSLSGVLSPSIGNLSHLQMMLLQNNEISGPIPFEIGKLSGLHTLDLSGNQLMGEIPSSLGSLTHLSYLRLSNNNLSGQIPRTVADLIGLSFLDLSFNNFSGPIPRIFAKEYSVAGNMFLCTSTHSEGCIDMPKPAKSNFLRHFISSFVLHFFGCDNAYKFFTVAESNSSEEADNHGFVVAISVSLSCTLVFAVVLVVYCLGWCRWNILFLSDGQEDYEFEMGHLKRFSFRDLQVATDNFSRKNILGQGGFGVVYKGLLRNGKAVAVKRLKDPNFTGEVQFQTEVEMIGLVLHRNLLRLYGFCLTSNERLLVYPYMPNGSVADRLRGPRHEKPSLDWNRRMRIALGAARGLLYLHEQCNPKIIHRDVKAANILLDENFEAIVGDFGLAKLLDRRDSHVTTAVRGTLGHIAPEYLSTGQSSEKTDVYGFGILILELVTGYKVLYTANGAFQKGMILDWVRGAHEEKNLDTLVDVDLGSSYNVDELDKAVCVALLCTQSDPSLRPRMSDVVRVLETMSGTTEHMEDSRGVPGERVCSFSRSYSNYLDESSFIVEAMELSGPR